MSLWNNRHDYSELYEIILSQHNFKNSNSFFHILSMPTSHGYKIQKIHGSQNVSHGWGLVKKNVPWRICKKGQNLRRSVHHPRPILAHLPRIQLTGVWCIYAQHPMNDPRFINLPLRSNLETSTFINID